VTTHTYLIAKDEDVCYLLIKQIAARMASSNCRFLIYFIGGLGGGFGPPSRAKSGIAIMKEAVAGAAPKDTRCELHSYSLATITNKSVDKRGSTIPFFTCLTAAEHARQLSINIQTKIEELNPEHLIVVAHSTGTAVLRHAIATIVRSKFNYEQQEGEKVWTSILKRIIHVGGMTTGWEFNSEVPKLYLWFGPVIRPLCPHWLPWQIYKGSKFITETRITLNRQHDRNRVSRPIQPQEDYLLGTKDEYITPADAIETGGLIEDGNPRYIEVAGCTHNSILSGKTGEVNKDVKTYILQALLPDEGALPAGLRQIEADDIDDYLDPLDNEPARRDPEVDHVIIILHGIRDGGMWAKRIGNTIKDVWRDKFPKKESRTIRVVSPAYGYFSLWDFLRPGGRRNAVDWYQNIYANVCALYPSAKVSFLGHSNGTYIGTQALNCENLDYKYMILAGSVVRCDFWVNKNTGKKWKPRVSRLFNFRSMDDWIVALLPGGLEVLPLLGRWMNLGGGGAYGFKGLEEGREQRTIKGGHGAAIQTDAWEQLARFLIIDDDRMNQATPDVKGLLAPVTSDTEPSLWAFNRFLNLIKLAGGLVIILAIVLCFLPFAGPLIVIIFKLSIPGMLKHPVESMLAIVVLSAIAFSCLKNI
jgi:hypothetical protein